MTFRNLNDQLSGSFYEEFYDFGIINHTVTCVKEYSRLYDATLVLHAMALLRCNAEFEKAANYLIANNKGVPSLTRIGVLDEFFGLDFADIVTPIDNYNIWTWINYYTWVLHYFYKIVYNLKVNLVAESPYSYELNEKYEYFDDDDYDWFGMDEFEE